MINNDQWSAMINNDQWSAMINNDQWSAMINNDQWSAMINNGQWSAMINNDQWSAMINNGQWSAMINNDQWSAIINKDQQWSMMINELLYVYSIIINMRIGRRLTWVVSVSALCPPSVWSGYKLNSVYMISSQTTYFDQMNKLWHPLKVTVVYLLAWLVMPCDLRLIPAMHESLHGSEVSPTYVFN